MRVFEVIHLGISTTTSTLIIAFYIDNKAIDMLDIVGIVITALGMMLVQKSDSLQSRVKTKSLRKKLRHIL